MQHLVLDVPVDVQTLDEAIAKLDAWLRSAKRAYISTCTVYTVMAAADDPTVADALRHADMVTADGMPLVWLQRLAGFRSAGRVYGPDLFLALCQHTEARQLRHFFFGGAPGIAEKLAATLQARFPGMTIAGCYAPAVSDKAETVDTRLVDLINEAHADIVWVGLGSPKQDLWMYRYRPHLNATLLVGVGAAFDFITGTKRQAPRWMQRNGLEWLFRLLSEPRRLWKRYLVYNSRFVYAFVRSQINPGSGHHADSSG